MDKGGAEVYNRIALNRKCAFLILFLLALGTLARGGTGDVRYLSTPEYLGAVTGEIQRATSSVTACLYLFTLATDRMESKTMQLAEALSDARRRGVRVEVLLDGTPDFQTGINAGPEERNRSAYDFLNDRGVDVFYTTGPLVHAKTIVVDESVVIAGSNNWSEAALSTNVEGSLLARDPETARRALDDIRRVPRRKLPEAPPAARVPGAFFTDPKLLGRMSEGDQSAFDLYLFLLKESRGQGALDEDFPTLAEYLGLSGRTRDAYVSGVTAVLKKLQNRYGLIRAKTMPGRGSHIEIVPLAGETVGLPAEYWTWGWDKALTLHGKIGYLLNRKYSASSATRPKWSLPVREIVRQNHIADSTVTDGTTALRRANLLTVDYDELDRFAKKPRRPSIYTPSPLYDPASLRQRWEELAARYGKEKLDRARRSLALVYEDSDARLAEIFIRLEDQYGREKMDMAYDIIARKKGDNPLRTAGYFIGVVKGESK